MIEDIYLLLGDSWYVVLAFTVLGVIIVAIDAAASRAKTNQSHRDTILFDQIEEFRRDFS